MIKSQLPGASEATTSFLTLPWLSSFLKLKKIRPSKTQTQDANGKLIE
jgi:hypothetical protein